MSQFRDHICPIRSKFYSGGTGELSMFGFTASARLRRSPYHDAILAAGVSSFTTYNRMLLPTGFGDPEAEYWRLVNDVSMWDVAVERQIEIKGPDAACLTQVLSPRRLDRCVVGQGKYVPICNHRGTIINDPIVLKLADDRFWLSIADSDMLFWSRAIAAERNFQVDICEADVSPLAVQGPKADDVVASIFGDWVRELKHFWFRDATVNGIPLMVARSGWSKQGGYELYLMDGSRGTELWDIVREAGEPFNIGPGNPNACERVESGLLSWGGDTDEHTNPYEIRMADSLILMLTMMWWVSKRCAQFMQRDQGDTNWVLFWAAQRQMRLTKSGMT